MKEFVKIKTIYSNSNERNIEFLSSFYEDKVKLFNIISELLNKEFIQNGFLKNKEILLKPNWVVHSTLPSDEICLRTHNNFVLAVLEVVASQNPSKITIADAPVQGCQWEKMITVHFSQQMKDICKEHNVLLVIRDFRKTIFYPNLNFKQKINFDEDYTTINLGSESMLEPLTLNNRNPFRNTHYDADRLKESHYTGNHKYCIANDFLRADVVISLPKVKTHQKAGITCAVKNLVGIIGDKDCLPHHRIGGSEMGGDCYPGKNKIRYISEKARDKANRNAGNYKYTLWAGISYLLWELLPKRNAYSKYAGWYGNDTTWRMVHDLNKIAVYGKANGTISSNPQRTIYSLCDGIVGGQGDGPLRPIPLPLGIISFTNDSVLNDIGMAILMGFDWQKINLLKNSATKERIMEFKLELNNQSIDFLKLKSESIKTIPPPGWERLLEGEE